jgi:hypothetical protein
LETTIDIIQPEIDRFVLNNILSISDINFEVRVDREKQFWIVKPLIGKEYPKSEIINGYIQLRSGLFGEQYTDLRIVSFRPELDLLFFLLSQHIQAKAIVPDFPPELIVIPWRELITEGVIGQKPTNVSDLLSGVPDPDETYSKFGTNRDLTANDVRRYTSKCNAYTKKGGSVKGYYQTLGTNPPFALETLRGWLKNHDLNPHHHS